MSDDTGTKSDGAGKKIELQNVSQVFPGRLGTRIRAVDNVSFDLSNEPPKIISLVGASGSGKSTIARIILGLQRPTGGSVRYGGKNIFRLSRRERDTFRRDVQPVFQDPYSIFNPFYRVDRIFFKAIKKFKLVKSKTDAITMIERSLSVVQLTPSEVLGRYAHQLSGGQRQRLMLARLPLLQPSYVLADEPVSMFDAQVRKNF
ncbi:MAG: ATP-binding cassette domain-containing protein, partial [Mycobacteriales bacterium]